MIEKQEMESVLDSDIICLLDKEDTDYIIKFENIKKTGSKIEFNVAAFFFGAIWLAYRRLYEGAILYVVIQMLLFFIPAIGIIAGIVAGLFGNYYYLCQLEKKAAVLKALDGEQRESYIKKNKGANSLALAICIAAYITVSIIGAIITTL